MINQCHFGDCRATMRRWSAEGVKVQTCITSPPYFGLRDYGHPDQIGLEETPDEYIDAMVEVFRCVRDVLANDGTLWLNIGDSYASKPNGPIGNTGLEGGLSPHVAVRTAHARRSSRIPPGLKHKDLIGIPWMLAFALRADGWYLRQEIIWNKPNPMPESVTDRCTKAHESIFLLTKSPIYFIEPEGMREQAAPASIARWAQNVKAQAGSDRVPGKTNGPMKAVGGSRRTRGVQPGNVEHSTLDAPEYHAPETRNRRSVWTVATRPYKGAHFATYPPELIEPCVLAGSRPGDIVLDPFFGSGTTGMVAQQYGRNWLGCELNQGYKPLQDERLQQPGLRLEAA